jgi:hypothetical protein
VGVKCGGNRFIDLLNESPMPVRSMGQKLSGGMTVKAVWRDFPSSLTGCHQAFFGGQPMSNGASVLPSPTNVIHRSRHSAAAAAAAAAASATSGFTTDGGADLFDVDLQKPASFDALMQQAPVSKDTQVRHAWNPDDRSLNIFIKDEDDGLTVSW